MLTMTMMVVLAMSMASVVAKRATMNCLMAPLLSPRVGGQGARRSLNDSSRKGTARAATRSSQEAPTVLA